MRVDVLLVAVRGDRRRRDIEVLEASDTPCIVPHDRFLVRLTPLRSMKILSPFVLAGHLVQHVVLNLRRARREDCLELRTCGLEDEISRAEQVAVAAAGELREAISHIRSISILARSIARSAEAIDPVIEISVGLYRPIS